MKLQILADLRESVRGALKAEYPGVDIFTAEITSINNSEGETLDEFFTVFFSEGDETEEGESLDSDTYRTDTQITVGYFNKAAETNQSYLESEAESIREAVMSLNVIQKYFDKITRAGWQYIPPVDGAISGIYFRFGFSFSN